MPDLTPSPCDAEAYFGQTNKIQPSQFDTITTLPVSIESPEALAAREQKIATIKKALGDGSYHVSSSDVAAKLIDYMLNVGGRRIGSMNDDAAVVSFNSNGAA